MERETGTRIGRRLYLGWDVGGWLGKTDGLAAYILGHTGNLIRRIPGKVVSMWKEFDGKRWSLERLVRLLDPQLTLERFDRVVVGIDAPLGMPAMYMRAMQADITKVPAPEYHIEKFLDSRLAFRITDRLVASRFDLKPLSPSLERITNNASKARAAVAEFAREIPKFAVPPFLADKPGITRFVAIEVYPAVWWTEKWINFTSLCIPEPERGGDETHIRDAATCALNALWYDLAVSGLPGRFPLLPPVDPQATPAPEIQPAMLLPERLAEYDGAATADDRDSVTAEGWIYAPDSARA